MTKREGAIVSAYTGYMLGDFTDLQKYAQELFGRPILTHEFASREFIKELQSKSFVDFNKLKTM